MAAVFLTGLVILLWSANEAGERKSFAEWREGLEEWREAVREREKTSGLLLRSEEAALVEMGIYLDGGSVGYGFTNQLGSYVIFLPHPFGRKNWDGETAGWRVTDQELFVGPVSAGRDGLEVKIGSKFERKLKALTESAKRTAQDTEHMDHLDRIMKVIETREFDWTDFRE